MVSVIREHKVGHIQDFNNDDNASGFCQKSLKGHLELLHDSPDILEVCSRRESKH